MAKYKTGDKVILASGREAVILLLEGKTDIGQQMYRVLTHKFSHVRAIEFSIHESSIKGLANSKSVCVNRDQIAKSIAMITRLTYAEAIIDIDKGIKAMNESGGACKAMFDAKIIAIEGDSDWMWAGKG